MRDASEHAPHRTLRIDRSPCRRGPLVVLLAVASFAATACATAPQLGVRGEYRQSNVTRATVLPFFTLSTFGHDDDDLDARLRWAERAALDWLEEHGVRAEPPEKTRQKLTEAAAWNHFTDGGIFVRNLAESFESSPRRQRRETQTDLLRTLRAQRHVGDQFVLFGEIVYQTSGTCHTRADEHATRVEVAVAPGAPDSPPRPCVVTHFRARLVDADSGATVWYNRRMRELYLPNVDESSIQSNIRTVVFQTLGADDGLSKLVGGDRS